jgi:hypothetical protein
MEETNKYREPVQMTVQEAYELYYGQNRAKVGSFKRKAKGSEYKCPRILLRRYFDKYIGRTCVVLEGKVSIEGRPYCQNRDAIILLV